MHVDTLFDPRTWTLTHLVSDPDTKDAIVIDSVLDFDPATGKVWTESIDKLLALVSEKGLTLRAALDTHAHADHLSGAHTLRERLGIPVVIGGAMALVQARFAPIFAMRDFPCDARQFDIRAKDEETLTFGSLRMTAIHTPGHTPACVTWHIGDALFTGDALFMPDSGVGRCDFPDGSADQLYTSVHERLYRFPDETRVFVGHDYQPGGRAPACRTTIGASKAENIQLPETRSREEFVSARTARDATLTPPRLLYYSLQVNINAGQLPAPGPDGKRFLLQPIVVGG